MATVLEIHVLLPCFTAIIPRVCVIRGSYKHNVFNNVLHTTHNVLNAHEAEVSSDEESFMVE